MVEKEIVDSLRNLHDLTKAINSSLHIEDVMEMICSKTARLMKAERGLLFVLDAKKSTLTIHSKLGFTEEEMQKMKTHPDIGAKILGFVDEMQDVIPGVQHHHEWFDGSGYPAGMQGENIPLAARIIAIADAFDALTTDRPYHKALDKEATLQIMADDAGKHFDPNLVTIFHPEF